MSGLMIDGHRFEVPGVQVVSPGDAAWAHLSPGDGRPRTNRPNKVVLHKTKADDPEVVRPGRGPSGRAERTARMWSDDPTYSGAHGVIGSDLVACLADLIRFEAFHARAANQTSIGFEMYEELGGIVYQAILDNAVKVCWAVAEHAGIQAQCTRWEKPLTRFRDGGRALFGFFGHRNVDDSRNKWDPGPAIWEALIASGFEVFDFERGEDLTVWKARQRELVAKGHDLVVDGFPGEQTRKALLAEGYRGGIYALGRDKQT
ncbi:MAG TPA: N-acetylmuramoyl-L-alanine amidase [Methylomirabilota bacterium]|nr:N-acetylmuramoyl-L-alanine amidase [Methylomirabilota bacterium]